MLYARHSFRSGVNMHLPLPIMLPGAGKASPRSHHARDRAPPTGGWSAFALIVIRTPAVASVNDRGQASLRQELPNSRVMGCRAQPVHIDDTVSHQTIGLRSSRLPD